MAERPQSFATSHLSSSPTTSPTASPPTASPLDHASILPSDLGAASRTVPHDKPDLAASSFPHVEFSRTRELGGGYAGERDLLTVHQRNPELMNSGPGQGPESFGDESGMYEERTEKEKKSGVRTPTIDSFGIDLTGLAREGKLDPVIGREQELERILQILSRRSKNNPLVIGEAGVGKTAVVEGLARRIAAGDVPDGLLNARVVMLDLVAMVAGTQYRGQFEQRMKGVLQEAKRDPNLILFIDEIHTIIGAGGAEGSLSAGNILKPALARGEFRCIGATTLKESRYIEKDAALSRRFQAVTLAPPNSEHTLKILQGVQTKYEGHHRVKYTPEALKVAVELTDRYISERFQPDKALDAIDEAGAAAHLEHTKAPAAIKKLRDEITEKEQAYQAARAVKDIDRLAQLRAEKRTLEDRLNIMTRELKEQGSGDALVTGETIRGVVARMTGIPLSQLSTTEAQRYLVLDKELKEMVIGQDQACELVAKDIKRRKAGLADPKRPSSFIFAGKTGVGKTHLAKALAKSLFGTEEALVTLDMSDFMEKHSTSRLGGAPPGYVGYEEGGQLTERIRRRPYSVILLDEIEKAHPEVFDMLLQVLEEGRLTDGQGRVVDFKNTLIIMTSNLGAQEASDVGFGFGAALSKREDNKKERAGRVRAAIESYFRPEFVNRVDNIVVFNDLERPALERILGLEIKGKLAPMQGLGISVTLNDDATTLLMEKGYSPQFGARPLKRAIDSYLIDPLSEELLKGTFAAGDKVFVKRNGDALSFEKVAEIPAQSSPLQRAA